jgi:uncharacterized repeat protein (TIGR01451 family)
MTPRRVLLFALLVLGVSLSSLSAAVLRFDAPARENGMSMTLRRDGAQLRLTDDTTGVLLVSTLAATTDRVIIRGADGEFPDTLTIDLAESLELPQGIDWIGGDGGYDVMNIRGGQVREQRVAQLTPNDGDIDLDGLTIRYRGLEPVTDTAPALNYVINGTAGADAITITDGPGGTTTVSSPSFESITFANKTNVTIDGLGGGDTVIFNNPTSPTGLSSLTLTNIGTVTQTGAIAYPSLTITSTGAVTLSNAGNSLDAALITATGAVTLTNNGATTIGIDSGAAVNVSHVGALSLEIESQGAITVNNIGNLTLGGVSAALTGINAGSAAGNVLITAVGSITLTDTDGVESVRGSSTAGDVTLIATGATSDISSTVNRDAITAPGGSITLNAGQDILLGLAGVDFDNDVRAAANVTLTAGRHITVHGFSDVSAADQGGTGVVVATAGQNITISGDDGSIGTAGAGNDVTLTSTAGIVDISASVPNAVFSSGDVVINTDKIAIAATSGVTASTGTVTIQSPTTAAIVLGSATDLAAATIELSDAELDRIFTPTVILNTNGAAPITVTAAIDAANTSELILQSGGTFNGPGPIGETTLGFVYTGAAGAWLVDANAGILIAPGGIPITITTAITSSLEISGGSGADSFTVQPGATTAVVIDGNLPIPPAGDLLNVITGGTTSPMLTVGSDANGYFGTYSFADRQSVSFSEIESLISVLTDLAVTKTDGSATATAGAAVTYTITVSNAGPIGVVGASVTDVFPITLTGVTWSCVGAGGAVCASPGGTGNLSTTETIPVGGSLTYTATGTLSPSATGTLTNTATVTAPTGFFDTLPTNNSASDIDAIDTSADIGTTKSGPATVVPGGTLGYTVTVSNNGPSDATNVSLTDALPANTSFVSVNQTSGPAFTCGFAAGTVTCTAATLAAGATAEFSIVFQADAAVSGGTITNEAFGSADDSDPNEGNNLSSTTADVVNADLTVTKSAPATAFAGQNITYTITIANSGATAADVTLGDNLPAGTTFVSLTQTGGPVFTCSTPAVGVNGAVSCSLASMAAAASATFDLVVATPATLPDATIISNTATVATTSPEPDTTDNSSTATTTVNVSSDLAVTKSALGAVTAGSNLTYTIVVSNNGPSVATAVALADTLPAGTTFVSLAQTAGASFSCTTPAVGASGPVNCTLASMNPATSATFELVVLVDGTTANGTNIVNTATVSSTSADPSGENNSAQATTVVSTGADIAVTKSGAPTATAGGTLVYTIGLTNNGPSTATSVTLDDTLPAGTTFVSLLQGSGPLAICTTPAVGGTGTISCSFASLPAASSASWTLTVNVDAGLAAGTVLTNTAVGASAVTDDVPGNNSATATTTVGATFDLSVTKSGSATAAAGGTLTYTITVANSGPSTATGVTLSDTLPAGTTFASLTQTSGPLFTCVTPAAGATGTVSCTLASMATASASFELVVNVAPEAVGTSLVNTAVVAAVPPDANVSNNSSTATSSVASSIPLFESRTLLLLALILAVAGATAIKRL